MKSDWTSGFSMGILAYIRYGREVAAQNAEIERMRCELWCIIGDDESAGSLVEKVKEQARAISNTTITNALDPLFVPWSDVPAGISAWDAFCQLAEEVRRRAMTGMTITELMTWLESMTTLDKLHFAQQERVWITQGLVIR